MIQESASLDSGFETVAGKKVSDTVSLSRIIVCYQATVSKFLLIRARPLLYLHKDLFDDAATLP